MYCHSTVVYVYDIITHAGPLLCCKQSKDIRDATTITTFRNKIRKLNQSNCVITVVAVNSIDNQTKC